MNKCKLIVDGKPTTIIFNSSTEMEFDLNGKIKPDVYTRQVTDASKSKGFETKTGNNNTTLGKANKTANQMGTSSTKATGQSSQTGSNTVSYTHLIKYRGLSSSVENMFKGGEN